MSKELMSAFTYDVFCINNRRMAALEELRSKMDSIAKDEKRITEQLLSAASPEAREFLRQTTVIEDLFVYGLAIRKIHFGVYAGLDDVATIKRVLKSLHSAWNCAVSVDIVNADGGRVEVKFRATTY